MRMNTMALAIIYNDFSNLLKDLHSRINFHCSLADEYPSSKDACRVFVRDSNSDLQVEAKAWMSELTLH